MSTHIRQTGPEAAQRPYPSRSSARAGICWCCAPTRRRKISTHFPAAGSIPVTVFLADDTGGDPVAMDDAKQVGWFTPNEIQDLPVPQSMVDCMKMLAGRHRAA
jgi:hypothetical protein